MNTSVIGLTELVIGLTELANEHPTALFAGLVTVITVSIIAGIWLIERLANAARRSQKR
jgi:hypothetical protein